ncbi:hypothetical protein ACFLZ1_02200 [Patescibacteria group bacterium]
MKKIFPILVVLLLAVFLAGCTKPSQDKDSDSKGTAGDGKQAGKEESYSGTLKKMMTLGVPLKCTWKQNENYYGTAYIKGESSYSEVTVQGKTANVIVNNNCMWNWEKDNPQGMKLCFDPENVEEEVEGNDQGQANMEQMKPPEDLDYSCIPAVFSDSKFDPPGDVKFLTLEEMMGGAIPEGMPEGMPQGMPEGMP